MDFVAFDTETTGVSPHWDEVIEIGAALFSDGEPVATFSELIDPGRPIPRGATQIHGITNEMVSGKPMIADVLPRFAEFCVGLPLVAHNARFDFKFIDRAVRRLACAAPTGPILDTLALSRKIWAGLPNYQLGTLVRVFGLPSGRFHRAADDALSCGRVFQILWERCRINWPDMDLDGLVKICGRRRMRFKQFAGEEPASWFTDFFGRK